MRGGWGDNIERLPLADGEAEWKKVLSVDLPEGDHFALLEFVCDDDPEQFIRDAAALRRFLN